jgi:hypothetical protein
MNLGYAVEQRLRLIDFLLFHYGSVGRSEIVDFFDLGSATATRDFALYAELYPSNVAMNKVSKRWVKTETFQRAYP